MTSKQSTLKKVLKGILSVSLLGMGGGGNLLLTRQAWVNTQKLCTLKSFEQAFGLVWLLPGPVATKLLVFLSYQSYPRWWVPFLTTAIFITPGILLLSLIIWAGDYVNMQFLRITISMISFLFMFDFCLSSLRSHLVRYRRMIGPSLFVVLSSLLLGILTHLSLIHYILIYIVGFSCLQILPKLQHTQKLFSLSLPLIWTLIQTGLFIYGGAYAMITHLYYKWCVVDPILAPQNFWYAVGLAHLLPGPLMNFVSYIGISQGSILSGWMMSYLLITPPCLLTCVLTKYQKTLLKNKLLKRSLIYFFPFIMGILLIQGLRMISESLPSVLMIGVVCTITLLQQKLRLSFKTFLLFSVTISILTAYVSMAML